MKRYARKPSAKQIWSAVKLLLLTSLILAAAVFLYYLGTEGPDWAPTGLLLPLVVVEILTPEQWRAGSLLLGILAVLTFFAMMAIPCRGNRPGLRRYLLRPAAAALVLLLIAQPSRAWINKVEDRAYHLARAPLYYQIQQKIEKAEAAVCSDGGSHATQVMAEYLPQFTYKGTKSYDDGSPVYYVRTVILLDYDVPEITFCHREDGEYCMKTLKLTPCEALPASYDKVDVIKLRYDAHSLNVYGVRSDRNGHSYDVTAVVLSMIDGRKFIVENPTDHKTGEPMDLPGFLNVVNEYIWFENFKEKQ